MARQWGFFAPQRPTGLFPHRASQQPPTGPLAPWRSNHALPGPLAPSFAGMALWRPAAVGASPPMASRPISGAACRFPNRGR